MSAATSPTTATDTVPGYRAGTWTIDPAHSEVGFSVRHMMVSKVRGKFATFAGELVTADDIAASSVTATIDLASIDTGNPDRDNHLRSADFFDADQFPQFSFASTGVSARGDHYLLDGALTLKGVTKAIVLQLELGGFGPDAYGGYRAGFSATTEILRSEFGVDFNAVLETGGVIVSDKVTIHLEIEAVLNQ